ncbi:hypothetical protein HHI36_004999 [Cryptolaemus montrouzieri]|uniref:Uncharacterized protein n=1 Tax=Cryptolaemus montrouzieri TaxID=559131 RepID=A0ABD2NTA0_9CUCU
MASIKRKSFSIEKKSVIIQRLEAGQSKVTIVVVSLSTISTIEKNKHKIEPLFNANISKPKRVRVSYHVQVDWPNLRAKFCDDEIFNADETGLFYKLTPDKTLKFRVEKCSGGKLSKERIIVRLDGFVRDGPGIADSISVTADNNDDDDVPLSVWARALKEGLPIENEELEQYSSVDVDIATFEEPTDENILHNVIVNSQDSDDNDVDDGPEKNYTTPSVSEVLKATEVLNLFVHFDFDNDTLKSIMSRLHNAVRTSYYRNENHKQSKLQTFCTRYSLLVI